MAPLPQSLLATVRTSVWMHCLKRLKSPRIWRRPSMQVRPGVATSGFGFLVERVDATRNQWLDEQPRNLGLTHRALAQDRLFNEFCTNADFLSSAGGCAIPKPHIKRSRERTKSTSQALCVALR